MAVPQETPQGEHRTLRVAYFGPLDVVARGVEATVGGDPYLCWVGQEHIEEPFHLLLSVTSPDVVVVARPADPYGRVVRSLRYAVPAPAAIVLAEWGEEMATHTRLLRWPVLPAQLAAAIHGSCGQEPPDEPPPAPRPATLTAPEMEVLCLVADGHRTDSIAAELGISPNTVKKRAHRLFTKLKVRDRAHAVARAYECGLLPTANVWPVEA